MEDKTKRVYGKHGHMTITRHVAAGEVTCHGYLLSESGVYYLAKYVVPKGDFYRIASRVRLWVIYGRGGDTL